MVLITIIIMAIIIIIIITLTESKELPFLEYQKSNQKSKNKYASFGFRVAFQTDPNLKNILCKNKDKLILNSYPGV